MTPKLILIAAGSSTTRIIGNGDRLPWPTITKDLQNFKRLTLGYPVIVGRKTFETFRNKAGDIRPLPNRQHVVITRQADYVVPSGVLVTSSVDDAIENAKASNPENIFVIGGQQIYEATIDRADIIYYTEVYLEVEGDTFFPPIPQNFKVDDFNETTELVQFPDKTMREVLICFQKWVKQPE